MKTCVFASLTDNVTKHRLQVVIPIELLEDDHLNLGTAIAVNGELRECPPHLKQDREVIATDVKVMSTCSKDAVPLDLKKSSLPWAVLRQNITTRHMMSNMKALLRLRSNLVMAAHEYMKQNEYVNITTPIITQSNCEGGSDVFTVKSPCDKEDDLFFDRPAYLSVSGQLHLEAMINAIPRVYTIAPAFRAENQLSRRHLSEFTMVEIEEAFVHSLDDLLDRAEDFVRFLANHAIANCSEELEFLKETNPREKYFEEYINKTVHYGFERLTNSKKYLRITYDDAIEIVSKSADKGVEPINFGSDLKRQHEKVIQDYFEGFPIFITHYPSSLKPFYMKREDDRALNFDLLAGIGGEVVGGSLREDNYQLLKQRIDEMSQKDDLEWYLNLRKMGQPPHGGFGLGFDRLLQSISDVGNIRDVVPFPRWAHHLNL